MIWDLQSYIRSVESHGLPTESLDGSNCNASSKIKQGRCPGEQAMLTSRSVRGVQDGAALQPIIFRWH
jgi:hypothetical protein